MTSDPDSKAIRRRLDAMRARHGAASKIGGHCSNALEILKNYPAANDAAKLHLTKSAARTAAELARLLADDADPVGKDG